MTSPFRVQTSTVVKSVAKMNSQCAFRKDDHAVVRCRPGAGSMPCALMERITSLWCVVWSHLIPLFIVLLCAFKRIPQVVDESGWPVGIIFVGLAGIAYVMLTCVLFVASAFLAILFYRVIGWMLGIELSLANAINAGTDVVIEER